MNNMLVALEITALGMGLVFAAIVVLWGMMTLLTALSADKEPVADPTVSAAEVSRLPILDGDLKPQAAAVVVAIAIAEQRISMEMSSAHPLSDPPTAIVSAWQLGMRTRQMHQKGGSIRRRAG